MPSITLITTASPYSVTAFIITVPHTAAGCGAVTDYGGADHKAIFTTSILKPASMQVIYSARISALSP